ncbi:MAG: acyl-CoA dehydratase activase [Desulfuromonadaceae bacterium]|nr:acyl-CoA dehydratase activase [Desulfuromonadaceae bacterium]MDD2855573.1 acyl-CoA dehydratase activase [Desulfuromonadaceae bacterium]
MKVGIDLGSRTVKAVLWHNDEIISHQITESSFDPHRQALAFLDQYPSAAVVATGYGRHLLQQHRPLNVITEIKAHAIGARHLFAECRTILDVGGQDSKVILLDESGRVSSFQMNDKCAAGTGRFLEMMSVSLGYELEEFGRAAAETDEGTAINSMCAVFAESEVVSLKNRGVPPSVIARSVHLAVAGRLAAMVSKSGYGDHLFFCGGVANNQTLVKLLEIQLGVPVRVPPNPSITGALGAALHPIRL